MVWGYIKLMLDGVGYLDKVDGRLNGDGYIDVLENSLIPTLVFTSILCSGKTITLATLSKNGSATKGLL